MEQLQQQILALSPAERLRLIAFIASSLSDEALPDTFEVPEAWVQEALARNEALTSGKAEPIAWEAIKARIYGQ